MENKELDFIGNGCQYRVTLKNGYSFEGVAFTVIDDGRGVATLSSSNDSIESVVRIK